MAHDIKNSVKSQKENQNFNKNYQNSESKPKKKYFDRPKLSEQKKLFEFLPPQIYSKNKNSVNKNVFTEVLLLWSQQ